jgi:hypothetical protein
MLLEEGVRLARALGLVVGALLLLAHAAAAQAMEPPAVVDAFARARGDQDLNAAVIQFAEDAVLRFDRGRTRQFNGKAEIRNFFEGMSAQPPTILVPARHQANDSVIWSEAVLDSRFGMLELTGEAIVQNGKIISLVYKAGRAPNDPELPASLAAQPLPSSGMMVGGVGLFGVGLLSLAGVRSQRASGSRLNGRMLTALRHWRDTSLS